MPSHGVNVDGQPKSWSSDTTSTDLAFGDDTPFDAQLRHFVDVIHGRVEPRCSGEDGLRALAVCKAVKEAMQTGRAVEVEVI